MMRVESHDLDPSESRRGTTWSWSWMAPLVITSSSQRELEHDCVAAQEMLNSSRMWHFSLCKCRVGAVILPGRAVASTTVFTSRDNTMVTPTITESTSGRSDHMSVHRHSVIPTRTNYSTPR